MSDLPKSRAEAKELNIAFYNTGKPCVNGHLSDRKTNDGHCLQCNHERARTPEKKAKAKKHSKRYHAENRERILEDMRRRNKAYYQKNKEKIKKQVREYQTDNAEWRREYICKWNTEKLKNDPYYKMARSSRRLVLRLLGLAGEKKSKPTAKIVGYTAVELADHLEKQFTSKMTWDNYGEVWHIDHIKPVKWFFDNGITDPKIVNALSNLRPLCAKENMSKGAKDVFLL